MLFTKRIGDIFFALILIVIALPFFIIVSLLLCFSIGPSFIFRQKRPGKDKKIFSIFKFKTMNEKRDADGVLLPDSQRLTKIGKIVRKLSLDELPQMINVLKGDMSFVGPRPLLIEYLPLYNERQKKRHDVLPGITGWAQVNGRNNISWEKKFELDVYYVENWNLFLDIKIIFMTVKKVLLRKDVNKQGAATTEKFRGNS